MVKNYLDEFAQLLIKELQKDGRQSYRHLGRKLGVAEGTVRQRVKDLMKKDIIKIVAVPDPDKIGFGLLCIATIRVKMAHLKQISEELSKIPNVYFLANVTGDFDILAMMVFRNSQELADFHREKISSLRGIERIVTFVNMDTLKSPWANGLEVTDLLK